MKKYMNIKIEILFLTFIISMFIAFFSFSALASSLPQIKNYKLNGKEESVKFNPSALGVFDGKVVIEINASVPVKFNTIALCATTDSVCNRATAVKYFTKTDTFVSSVNKEWDGKTSKGIVAEKGDYKIKVTIKDDAGTEKTQELIPYVIRVDSSVSNVSSGSQSKSSSDSQENFDNDPVVKKIRDFIANGGEESSEIATIANSKAVKKSSISQNEKASSDNSRKTSITKFKKTELKKEEIISTSTTQVAEVVSSEDSNHESFIWKILNLPFDGFNLIRRLFYSGS